MPQMWVFGVCATQGRSLTGFVRLDRVHHEPHARLLSSTNKRTMHHCNHGRYSIEGVDSQGGDNKKYQDLAGSLVHGMQPGGDDLQHVSVKSISLRSHKCQAHPTASQIPEHQSNSILMNTRRIPSLGRRNHRGQATSYDLYDVTRRH